MSVPNPHVPSLNSWKEIAAYLGVSVRTAQLWERTRQLPVRRPGGRRGLVSAYPAELDAWRSAPPPAPRWRRWAGGVALLVAVVTAGAWLLTRAGEPADFRLQPRALIVLDNRGKELWRKEFGSDLLWGGYVDPEGRPASSRRVWIGDLDGDGRQEVLFNWWRADFSRLGSQLVCYSDRGAEKWRFRPGREVATRDERFSSVYVVETFSVAPMANGKGNVIAVSSHHYLYWPNQFVLLDSSGRPRGEEYWHAGQFVTSGVADLDRDGKAELYLGGTNNARKCGTLVVLDPDQLGGASQEDDPRYQLLGLPPAREGARILFPRSCISRRSEPYNWIWELRIEPGRIIARLLEAFGASRATTLYHFRPDLSLEQVQPEESFRAGHARLQASGLLDHALTKAEEREMEKIRVLRPLDLAGAVQ